MNRTTAMSESISVDIEPCELWAFVEDYQNDSSWRAGVTEMTPDQPGPPTIGTRVHEVVRKLGKTYVTDSVVTEVGPDLSYRFEGSGDSGGVKGGRSVTPNADGTSTFTYDIELRLGGVNALLAPLIGKVVARGLRRDLQTLRRTIDPAILNGREP